MSGKRHKRGFTLVELSIVLVIIGLLIGGILVAQSMVGTAKAQNYVRALTQYQVAISNFQVSYNSLPGDSNLFEPAGTNNGVTNDVGGCHVSGNYARWEESQAFYHLSATSMLKGDYIPYKPSICGGTMDDQPMNEAGYIYPYLYKSDLFTSTYGYTAKIPITFSAENVGGIRRTMLFFHLPIMDMKAVDAKIDDGISVSGSIISVEIVYSMSDDCDAYSADPANDHNSLCYYYWIMDL